MTGLVAISMVTGAGGGVAATEGGGGEQRSAPQEELDVQSSATLAIACPVYLHVEAPDTPSRSFRACFLAASAFGGRVYSVMLRDVGSEDAAVAPSTEPGSSDMFGKKRDLPAPGVCWCHLCCINPLPELTHMLPAALTWGDLPVRLQRRGCVCIVSPSPFCRVLSVLIGIHTAEVS